MPSIKELQAEINRLRAIESLEHQKRQLANQKVKMQGEIRQLKHAGAYRVGKTVASNAKMIGAKAYAIAKDRAQAIRKSQVHQRRRGSSSPFSNLTDF